MAFVCDLDWFENKKLRHRRIQPFIGIQQKKINAFKAFFFFFFVRTLLMNKFEFDI